jgi:hypothetical protein
MPSIHAQIQQLQAAIPQDQARVDQLEAQMEALRDDLSDLKQRYEAIVWPHQERLEAVQAELTKLEQAALIRQQPVAEWTPPEDYVPVEEQYRQSWITGQKVTTLKEEGYAGWTPPEDYIPVEEQYRRKWTPHEAPKSESQADFIPAPPPPDPTSHDLKTLYRHLARRYHPDYAQDEADLQWRTHKMAAINEAYAQENIEALRAFMLETDQASPPPPTSPSQSDSALELQLKQLRIIQQRLRRRLFALKQQIHDLEHSDLMRLKHEVWLGRLQGRDVLQDIAESIQHDYQALLKKLYRLRQA